MLEPKTGLNSECWLYFETTHSILQKTHGRYHPQKRNLIHKVPSIMHKDSNKSNIRQRRLCSTSDVKTGENMTRRKEHALSKIKISRDRDELLWSIVRKDRFLRRVQCIIVVYFFICAYIALACTCHKCPFDNYLQEAQSTRQQHDIAYCHLWNQATTSILGKPTSRM